MNHLLVFGIGSQCGNFRIIVSQYFDENSGKLGNTDLLTNHKVIVDRFDEIFSSENEFL